jgi:hypothetical protein
MPTNPRDLPYRPLVSGVTIANEVSGIPGTLGCIALDAQNKPWIISCYHVLGRARSSTAKPQEDEPILQSTPELGGGVVARTRLAKMNAILDYGAAIIEANVGVTTAVLSIGTIQRTAKALVGMRVIKSGAVTGITIGVVTDVTTDLITIDRSPEQPDTEVLSDRGDSGAVWLDVQTGDAIGLHFSGRDNDRAYARPLESVLAALELKLLR